MKHTQLTIGLSLLALLGNSALANPEVEMGLTMGGFSPDSDRLTKQYFNKDFYLQGTLGLKDDSGWELRGKLGHYGNVSLNPAELGNNLQLDVTPLVADLIYHASPASAVIQPYIGAGAGAYFYNVKDDSFGNMETGTRYGFNLTGGIKVRVMENVAVTAEYNKAYLPPVFFTKATNFNNSAFTIGVNFTVPTYSSPSRRFTAVQPDLQPAPVAAPVPAPNYRYTSTEENLLVAIQQSQTDLKNLRQKQADLNREINEFYLNSTLDEDSPEFAAAFRRIRLLEMDVKALNPQISDAESNVRALERQWADTHPSAPVKEQITYLERNYHRSPFGLCFKNGFFLNARIPQVIHREVRTYHAPAVVVNTPDSQTPTPEEKKQFIQKKRERLLELKNRTM